MGRRRCAAAALAAAALATAADAGATRLFRAAESAPPARLANSRLAGVPALRLSLDWDALAAAVADADAKGEPVQLAFDDAAGGLLECALSHSDVLAPGLAAQFPHFVVRSGPCGDGGTATLVFNAKPDSEFFSATLHTAAHGTVYVDHEMDTTFRLYNYSDAIALGSPEPGEFRCDAAHAASPLDSELGQDAAGSRNLADDVPDMVTGYRFRLAMLANRQYVNYHGGTMDTTMAAITALVTRVNGVYMRELGVYFQLVDNNHKLFCVDGGHPNCDSWPNDGSLLGANKGYIEQADISVDDYDLGHSVSTGSGGIANYPALCMNDRKAGGTTGTRSPYGDPFWVDYVAHEIGHQLKGAHSFRDCGGPSDGNRMEVGAVEPGSGSSIMGYAGICGSKNLQSNSDPYFNSINLEQMRDFVVSAASNCGTQVPTTTPRPIMETVNVCRVPRGSYVQLSGRVANHDDASITFAWDRVDTGYENFHDRSIPRFRSWLPIKSPRRFLPNLYYLAFDVLDSQSVEIPPSESVANGDHTMTFRFVGRTNFDADAKSAEFKASEIGGFGHKDVSLQYLAAHDPLRFTSTENLIGVAPNVSTTVRWTGGDTMTDSVQILAAVNTMTARTSLSMFRYESDLHDLEWVEVAVEKALEGSATFFMPESLPNLAKNRQVMLMIRSVGSDDCFFFDLLPGLIWDAEILPTPQPSMSPTKSPSPWSCPQEWYGSSDGCDCGCGRLDPDCEVSSAAIFCDGLAAGSETYCDVVDSKCKLESGSNKALVDETNDKRARNQESESSTVLGIPLDMLFKFSLIACGASVVFGVWFALSVKVLRTRLPPGGGDLESPTVVVAAGDDDPISSRLDADDRK